MARLNLLGNIGRSMDIGILSAIDTSDSNAEDQLTDMIVDVMNWAARHGLHPLEAHESALLHYYAEVIDA